MPYDALVIAAHPDDAEVQMAVLSLTQNWSTPAARCWLTI
jgi:hypothetical protein